MGPSARRCLWLCRAGRSARRTGGACLSAAHPRPHQERGEGREAQRGLMSQEIFRHATKIRNGALYINGESVVARPFPRIGNLRDKTTPSSRPLDATDRFILLTSISNLSVARMGIHRSRYFPISPPVHNRGQHSRHQTARIPSSLTDKSCRYSWELRMRLSVGTWTPRR